MNLARVSQNGQITVPSENRRQDSFLPEQQREIVLSNASSDALLNAQNAFSGLVDKLGINDEDDVQSLVDSVRYGGKK